MCFDTNIVDQHEDGARACCAPPGSATAGYSPIIGLSDPRSI